MAQVLQQQQNIQKQQQKQIEPISPTSPPQPENQSVPFIKSGFFAQQTGKGANNCSVCVALRVRPLIERQLIQSSRVCLTAQEQKNQLIMGSDRCFTFDRVFGLDAQQEQVFQVCVQNLVLGCFQGYNATVLAYGQTGSGKTYTMGSGQTCQIQSSQQLGIIPRVIHLVFSEVQKRSTKSEFIIKASFLQIYNEEIHDLLDPTQDDPLKRYSQGNSAKITIRQEKSGQIALYGLHEQTVNSAEEMVSCLNRGSNFRSTSSTLMNSASSRSHAIFTITIQQHVIQDLYTGQTNNNQAAATGGNKQSQQFMIAKFHFVDLAGSERAKRTGATGQRLKEGININRGLLALGNVISALTQEFGDNGTNNPSSSSGGIKHVPYRDSKLTRILQDSLGGNSRTSMIACVSPAEDNFEQTLNTLKYAARARNIKNKPVVNRDPNSAMIASLRGQVYELSKDVSEMKKLLTDQGVDYQVKGVVMLAAVNDRSPTRSNKGNMMMSPDIEMELQNLRVEKQQLSVENQQLKNQLKVKTNISDNAQLELLKVERERDILKFKIQKRNNKKNINDDDQNNNNNNNNNNGNNQRNNNDGYQEKKNDQDDDDDDDDAQKLVDQYQNKIQLLRTEVENKKIENAKIMGQYQALLKNSERQSKLLEQKSLQIQTLRQQLRQLNKSSSMKRTTNKQPISRRTTVIGAKRPNTSDFFGSSNVPRIKSGFDDWINQELSSTLQTFNQQFMSNLNASISQIFGGGGNQQKTYSSNKDFIALKKNNSQSILSNNEMKSIAQQIEVSKIQDQNEQKVLKPVDQNEDDGLQFMKMIDSQIQATVISNAAIKLKDGLKKMNSISSDDDENQTNAGVSNAQNQTDVMTQDSEIIDIERQTEEEMQMEFNISEQQEGLKIVEKNLCEKEELLKNIQEQHSRIQNNMLDLMKEQYHKKIQELEIQMQNLEQQRAKSPHKSSKIDKQFKAKLGEMENKIKQFRAKEKQSAQLQRVSKEQQKQITTLKDQIQRNKTQRVTLTRKIREVTSEHQRWKAEKGKQLIRAKQSAILKDRQIQKLKSEKAKKQLVAKIKTQEVRALQKKNKLDRGALSKKSTVSSFRKKNTSTSNQPQIQRKQIRKWLQQTTQKVLNIKQVKDNIMKERTQLQNLQNELEQSIKSKADMQLQMQRLSIDKENLQDSLNQSTSSNLPPQFSNISPSKIDSQIQQIREELNYIQQDIQSKEEKVVFKRQTIQDFAGELIQMYKKDPSSADHGFAMPKWLASMRSFQGQRAFLLTVFDYLLDICSGQTESWKLLARKDRQIELLNEKLKAAFQEVQNSNQEIRRMRLDYQAKKRALLEISDNPSKTVIQLQSTNSQPLKKLNDIRRQHKMQNQIRSSMINTTTPSQFSVMGSLAPSNNNTKSLIKTPSISQNSNSNSNNNNAPSIMTLNSKKSKSSNSTLLNPPHTQTSSTTTAPKQIPTIKHVNLSKRPSAAIVHNPSALKRQFSAQLSNISNNNNDNQSTQNYSSRSSSDVSEEMQQLPSTDQHQPGEESKQHYPIRSQTIDMITSQHQRQQSLSSSSKFTPSAVTNPTPTNNNVFNRLVPAAPEVNPKRSVPSLSTASSSTFQMQQYPDDNKWGCRGTISDAHPSPVCSLVNFENLLFSSSNKFFKVWNIDTLKQISQVEAHTSLIKAIRIWPEQNMFITACDKIISLWDLFSLKCIGSLKGHRDEVRSITTQGHQLFSAGKSGAKKGDDSSGSAALLVWDIRMTKCLVEEREPNQDIFSLQIANSPYDNRSELYAATRNHSVLRYDISKSNDCSEMTKKNSNNEFPEQQQQQQIQQKGFNMKPDGQLMPLHYDAVTSLALMKDNLVSGSRDGHLRVWNLWENTQLGPQKIQLAKRAHQDWINTLATNEKGDLLYSGCRQGVVRVWRNAKDKLRCRACIHAHSQSISDICPVPDFGSGLQTFITGSVDRSIRIFREYQSIEDSPS